MRTSRSFRVAGAVGLLLVAGCSDSAMGPTINPTLASIQLSPSPVGGANRYVAIALYAAPGEVLPSGEALVVLKTSGGDEEVFRTGGWRYGANGATIVMGLGHTISEIADSIEAAGAYVTGNLNHHTSDAEMRDLTQHGGNLARRALNWPHVVQASVRSWAELAVVVPRNPLRTRAMISGRLVRKGDFWLSVAPGTTITATYRQPDGTEISSAIVWQ